MPEPSLFQKIFARDPRRIARLPSVPIERALEELRQLQKTQSAAASPAAAVSAEADPALGQALSSLATHVWRAKHRMVDAKTGLPNEDMKRVYRHVEAAVETLRTMDVTMNDWLNQSYDSGLPVKVLTYQPAAGIERDTVIEATRPTVVWKNQLLQLGEVVVGIPEHAAIAVEKVS